MTRPQTASGWLALSWGLGGVLALLGDAVVRLGHHTLGALALEWTLQHWAVLVGWTAAMAYFEGYRGFQRAFSPRVVVRGLHLAHAPRALHVVLAPLFCMGLIHATRRRLVTGWLLLTFIVVLVSVVRQLEQPWRGLVDCGVVVALVWGVVTILAALVQALRGRAPSIDADLPVG